MLETLILAAIVLILPSTGVPPLWILLLCFVWLFACLPGISLTFRQAPPFVPTPGKLVNQMLEAAHLKHGDKVYDIGCGDGRILFAAAEKGATAIGYEYSVPTFLLARVRALFHPHAEVRFGDFWKQDYHDADVIFCYLFPEPMQRIYKEIWPQLKPGCLVISHAFRIKDLASESDKNKIIVYRK